MSKTRPPYTPEFRRQMVELVRAGRSPEELLDEAGGAEILVLGGRFTERDEIFEGYSWLRLPSH
jgi:hypothetical protein